MDIEFLVFDSEADAASLVERINAALGYPKGKTYNYAVPLVHKDGRAAVPVKSVWNHKTKKLAVMPDFLTQDEINADKSTMADLMADGWFQEV